MDSLSDSAEDLQRADCPLEAAALLFFDIETTSLRPDRGVRLTEVALLDRERVVPAWTGDSAREDDFLAERLPELFSYLASAVVLVITWGLICNADQTSTDILTYHTAEAP